MTAPRGGFGLGTRWVPGLYDPAEKYTGPTWSDDEVDEMYGIASSPLPDACCCFRDGEYVPESCDRADHRDSA